MKGNTGHVRQIATLVVALFVLCSVREAQAQFVVKWLNVGSLHHYYSEAGSLREHEPVGADVGLQWPAIQRYSDNMRSAAMWLGAKNFTDDKGQRWPVKIVHVGPREPGIGQVFPVRHDVVSRFEPPTVHVDGIQSFDKYVFVDEVDPDLPADRMIHNVVNTELGLTLERKILAWSQEHHDNYHLTEYVYTNTGNTDGDPEIELPDQTLEDVVIYRQARYRINYQGARATGGGAPWGQYNMNDVVGDGHQEYDVDFRAQYTWAGWRPEQTRFNSLGRPIWNQAWYVAEDDTVGRLTGAHFAGRVYIHADTSPTDPTDDPGQPFTMGYFDSNDPTTGSNLSTDVPAMLEEWKIMNSGRMWPHHADLVEPDGNFATTTGIPHLNKTSGGYHPHEAFGPYTLKPGESVRIVIAEAVDGLSDHAKTEIGKAYKYSGAQDSLKIPYTVNGQEHLLTKNQWVLTSKDSLFETFERAIANYKSGYAIPRNPLPPREFHVSSQPDRILLEWQLYPGATQTGWEIWRAAKRYDGQYERIASLPATATEYEDQNVVRGIDYYYYLQAVGEVNQDATGRTPTGVPLKSGRYYTQTYTPANLKRPPGGQLSDLRIVPNPFSLGADENIRWPDRQDKLGFLDLPGRCTIKIYTESGELIETIEHTDGSGDAYWNLTTSSRQLITSGLYIAVVTDHETGEQLIEKFIIIR